MKSKVFQIGFNRCGTTSIAYFFEKNGYRVVHGGARSLGRPRTLAVKIELARREGKPLLHYVGEYDVYTDMEKINVPRDLSRRIAGRFFKRLARLLDSAKEPSPIYAFKYFKDLDRQYPGSKFILNTRDIDKWISSRLRFNDRKYRSCRHGDRFHADEAELSECWREEWLAHHREVQEHFKDRPDDLLVFNIAVDDPGKLIDFFAEYNLDPKHWKHRNPGR